MTDRYAFARDLARQAGALALDFTGGGARSSSSS